MKSAFDRGAVGVLVGCVVGVGALCGSGCAEAALVLVREGQATAAIVLAAESTRSARLAAAELQDHVRVMSGATLPILSEKEKRPAGVAPIYVGESAATRAMGLPSHRFAPHECLVRVTAEHMVLIGRDDLDFGPIDYAKLGAWKGFSRQRPFYRLGTLYAAYEFLERFCGVRWYMISDLGRVVPARKTIALEPCERRSRPWTTYRYVGHGGWGPPGDPGGLDIAGINRYKRYASARDSSLFALRSRRGGEAYGVNHSVYDYAKRFGDQHPEWFVDGRPGPHIQLRYHHPGVIKQVTQDALDFFAIPFTQRRFGSEISHAAKLGGGDFFPVMPLDNRGYGTECKPPLQPDRQGKGFGTGVSSNYIYTWVNNVARGIRETYPDCWISTCAYAGMFEPPEFEMERNVAVTVAMADGWEGHGMEILKQWRANVSRLYTWEYHYDRGRFPAIRPRKVARYVKQLLAMGVDGMFMEEGNINPALYHLDFYVTMRLLVDPETDVEALLAEYFTLFYGPAAEPMKRFWTGLEDACREVAKGSSPAKSWVRGAPEARMQEWGRDLDEAARLAAEAPYASRIKVIRTGVFDYMKERASFFAAVEAAGLRQMDIPRTTLKPTLDGKIDDAVWQQAAVTPPFVSMKNNPLEVTTLAMTAYDDRNLYIAFRCEEPRMAEQNRFHTKSTSAICTDDSVEVNLDMDPASEDYVQIMLSVNSVVWVWWRKKHRPGHTPDLGIKGKAWRGEDGWSCELIIPFAKITGGAPKPGSEWRYNVMRNRHVKGMKRFDERIWQCWSPPFVWSWHIRERFGVVRFVE